MPYSKGHKPMKPFQKGYDPRRNGGGRPKIEGKLVGGRAWAVRILDNVLAEAETRDQIEQAFRDEIKSNPIAFFKQVVMPLLPRTTETTLQRATGLESLTIQQLKSIAGELPESSETPVIDVSEVSERVQKEPVSEQKPENTKEISK